MSFLQQKGISLLASIASVDLNGAGDTETSLFTVPAGYKAIIAEVVIHTLSASGASAVVTFGKTGGTCDEFRGDQTLSALDGTTKYVIVYPNQSTDGTPEGGILLVAGESFGVEITTAHGSAVTATIDTFGYLITA